MRLTTIFMHLYCDGSHVACVDTLQYVVAYYIIKVQWLPITHNTLRRIKLSFRGCQSKKSC